MKKDEKLEKKKERISKEKRKERKGKKWTEEDIQYLREGYCKYNLSIKEMAEALERTENAIRRAAIKNNIKRPKPKEEIPEGHKRCPTCKMILPFDKFAKNSSKPSGIDDYCIQCKSEKDRNNKKKKLELKTKKVKIHIKEKKCAKCKETKAIDEFYYFKKLNRYSSYCKTCEREKQKQYNIKKQKERGY